VEFLLCNFVVFAEEQIYLVERDNSSLATAVINTQISTVFNYDDTQVYIYGALSNEKENSLTPKQWIFYYVPVMAPVQQEDTTWICTTKNELRIELLFGNDDISELARQAIMKTYDLNVTQYAKFWDVVPLMIDSLMAYIAKRSSSIPVEGIHPFGTVVPNALSMIFRFTCSSEEKAKAIIQFKLFFILLDLNKSQLIL